MLLKRFLKGTAGIRIPDIYIPIFIHQIDSYPALRSFLFSHLYLNFNCNKGYEIVLIEVKKESDIAIQIENILKENQNFQGKPFLVKRDSKFFIYGFSPQGKWQLTEILDTGKLTTLKFNKNRPKLLQQPRISGEVYMEIARFKGHIPAENFSTMRKDTIPDLMQLTGASYFPVFITNDGQVLSVKVIPRILAILIQTLSVYILDH